MTADTAFAPRIVSLGEPGKVDLDLINKVIFDLPVYEWIKTKNTQFTRILSNKDIILDPCTDNLFTEASRRSQTTVNYLGFSPEIRSKLIDQDSISYTDFNNSEIDEYVINCLERQSKLDASMLLVPYLPVVSVDHTAYEYQKKFWKSASDFNSSNFPDIFGVVCHNPSLVTNKRYMITFLDDVTNLELDGIALYLYGLDEYNASVEELVGLIRLVHQLKQQEKKVLIFYTSSFGLILSIFGADMISSGACYMESREKAELRSEGGGMELTDPRKRYYVRPILSKVIITAVESVLEEVNYYCDCDECQSWSIPHPQVSLMQVAGSLNALARHFIIERNNELMEINKWKTEGTSFSNISKLVLNAIDSVARIRGNDIDMGIRNANPAEYLDKWHQALSACEDLI
jgi:hypothetical protein